MIPPVVHASWAMLALAVAFLLPTLFFILAARRGKQLHIRRIPGIDAIEEAIGRATELGRPIVFTTGLSGLGPLLFAVLGIVSHVAKKSASFGCRLIIPQQDTMVLPLVEETVREAHRAMGKLETFDPQDIRYLSDSQFAFASGYMGIVHRERAASCFLFGDFAAESLIMSEAGQQVGAMQVAGTPSYNQVPFFLTSCDYTVIGEEVYAAGAYLSRDPVQLGTVRGQDFAKLVILGLVAVGLGTGTLLSLARRDVNEGDKFNNPFARLLYVAPEQAGALARIEIEGQFKPDVPPEKVDLESELARARARYAIQAGRARGMLRGIAAGTREEERAVRTALDRFETPGARAEAEKLADELKAIADRAGQSADELDGLLRKGLPELEKQIAGLRARRAGELAAEELAALKYWVGQEKGRPGLENCAALVASAEATLLSGSPEQIAAAVARAREACYRVYFAEVGRAMKRVEAASQGRVPTYYRKLGKEREGLTLNGEKSVSGRRLPLQYKWSVKWSGSGPAGQGSHEFTDAVAEAMFDQAGTYVITLEVSEEQEPVSLPLPLGGADPSGLKFLQVTRGTEISLSTPLPETVKPGSQKVEWDLDGDGKFEKSGAETAAALKADGFLARTLTVQAAYLEKEPEADGGRKSSSAAAPVPPPAGVAALRRRICVKLPALADRLTEASARMGRMGSELALCGKLLGQAAKLPADSWPDRAWTTEQMGKLKGLRDWAGKSGGFLMRAVAEVETLGAPAVVLPPTADRLPPTAGQFTERWKRYRVYVEVLEPKKDTGRMTIRVAAAPELPRAPWLPPPEPPQKTMPLIPMTPAADPAAKPDAEPAAGGGL